MLQKYDKIIYWSNFNFLQVERSLEVYKQAYDIVLVEDETVDILNVILKELFKYSK